MDIESQAEVVVPPQAAALPVSVRVRAEGQVLVVTLARPRKRNALDDATIGALERVFREIAPAYRAAVLDAEGDHFSAGLDLHELAERDAFAGVAHSQFWHRAMEAIDGGQVPTVAALTGAVVGGGLELAAACHLRVADRSAFYALPEGQRGLFVGGGGSVRLPRLIGVARVMDLMLTGRRLDADEGQAAGLTQYLVETGTASAAALELARRIAGNAPQTNFAVLRALPRIAQASPDEGYLLESLMAAVAQSTEDAKQRMASFLAGRAPKVTDL
ncbi:MULTISPECIES: crotonase/enoyl-CoA hydratase family protein [Pseudofrankia]|uniref:crotonase/enoyl-CoA hydratase family protein n=1 Tax=Pseudofrankia TaxID=2994363 RepID=UPI000234BC7E|nr:MULTISPECIES: crotonase/enoyl-CoA hydratase family protein [Pseudofrankia]